MNPFLQNYGFGEVENDCFKHVSALFLNMADKYNFRTKTLTFGSDRGPFPISKTSKSHKNIYKEIFFFPPQNNSVYIWLKLTKSAP